MLIILGIIVFLSLIIILIAYKQSDRILIRHAKQNSLVFLPSQFKLPFEAITFKVIKQLCFCMVGV